MPCGQLSANTSMGEAAVNFIPYMHPLDMHSLDVHTLQPEVSIARSPPLLAPEGLQCARGCYSS